MKKKVYAYLHTHWDIEWYRNNEDFNVRFIDVFNIVLDELIHNRAPFFYMDGQIGALNDYLKLYPDKKEIIKNLVNENKLALGPYFVSADSYLINFCSMLKNIDIGLNFSKEFNQKEFIGYLSDIFGISKSVFDALKLKNIDKSIIWRGVNPKKINNNCNFLKDDIKTAWLVKGYFNDFFHQKEINILGIKKYLDDIKKYSNDILLLPIGADHLGMLKDANKKIEFVNKNLDDYEIILTSPFEYFKKAKFDNVIFEKEFLDNSDTYILPGVYSARIPQKIKNNEIQNKISRILEPLNFYLKKGFQNQIEEIYKTLLKNHAHDGIYGCSIDSVHRAIDYRIEKCQNYSDSLIKKIKGDFKKKYDIKGISKDKIGVFNLSNSPINTITVDLPYILKNSQVLSKENRFEDDIFYDIYHIPITQEIKTHYKQLIEITKPDKFSFSTVKIKKPIKKTLITKTSIENDFISLFIKNGEIYIENKEKDNKPIKLSLLDIADAGDSYNFAPKGEYKKLSIIKTKINYDGLIESSLSIFFKNIELVAKLNNSSKFIKFSAIINNKKKNHKLVFELQLNQDIKKTISQEAVGLIERTIDPNYKMQDYMPVKRPKELKTNSYPMQNFVIANGVIAYTKGLNEYEIYKNNLRIALLRAFNTISNPKNPARSIPAGPNILTPEGQCIEKFKAEFMVSFGNKKDAFLNVDNLFENYLALGGEYKEEINIKFDEIPINTFIYGINNCKKIGYNYEEDKISMI